MGELPMAEHTDLHAATGASLAGAAAGAAAASAAAAAPAGGTPTAAGAAGPAPADFCVVAAAPASVTATPWASAPPAANAAAGGDIALPDVVVYLASRPGSPDAPPPAAGPPAVAETHLSVGCQVVGPFVVAGLGMVGAGLYLDMVQDWNVFVNVKEIIILVPSLLGLKGNLEMTLAARLSTEANLGHMDDAKEQWSMILGNLTLVQCQAIVVGLLSAVVALAMVYILEKEEFNIRHTMLLCSCSIITSSIASLVLGLITATVIVVSRWLKINPDNVATPIAASLGDITSLALLSWVATMMYDAIDKSYWISPVVIICYILVIPFWVWIAKKNKYTSSVLYSGWTPVVVAMLISTSGGLMLHKLLSRYPQMAALQPVINGVGGNLVSVQASRLSTELHQHSEPGTLPPGSQICITPSQACCSRQPHAMTAQVLMLLVIPGHLLFLSIISSKYLQRDALDLTPLFVVTYLFVAFFQVAILLYVAYILTYFFWKRHTDPDNSTIPYLTALGDLLGIGLLGISFEFLSWVGDDYAIAPEVPGAVTTLPP
ncbi:hypothetical protein R5R35_006072 [Gryllus longicercus]